jgi:hypothetical protein
MLWALVAYNNSTNLAVTPNLYDRFFEISFQYFPSLFPFDKLAVSM